MENSRFVLASIRWLLSFGIQHTVTQSETNDNAIIYPLDGAQAAANSSWTTNKTCRVRDKTLHSKQYGTLGLAVGQETNPHKATSAS